MSFDVNLLCMAARAHPVTSLWLYLHFLNKVFWCLNGASRPARCNISFASLHYICTCRYLLQGVGYFCRALGCNLHGCCVDVNHNQLHVLQWHRATMSCCCSAQKNSLSCIKWVFLQHPVQSWFAALWAA